MFRSPRRRQTRQRSGYNVAGERSGSEALILRATRYEITSPHFALRLEKADAALTPQFGENIGMVASGGYVKVASPCNLKLTIEAIDPLDSAVVVSDDRTRQIPPNFWVKFGIDATITEAAAYESVGIRSSITLESASNGALGSVQFLGINLDAVSAYADRAIKDAYDKKTYLYYPEIYYFRHDDPFVVTPTEIEGDISGKGDGEQVVFKACNRCSRYLPIDVLNETNALGFSNHCGKTAPCRHGAFSRFEIQNWDGIGALDTPLDAYVEHHEQRHIVASYLGFQLECRPCKKFVVNAPLNPQRNAAQRREDSLRRRAAEQLVMQLLERDWIFYSYRQQHDEEFDTAIWERFGRTCFSCGKELPTLQDMDLDHTMPLVYLWPLDETATCLCSTCNAQKHDAFPFEFPPYQESGKLEQLAVLTGLDPDLLRQPVKRTNPRVVAALEKRVVWFFDEFLNNEDYQKVRNGKLTADLILASIQRVLDETGTGLDLVDAYRNSTGSFPITVTIDA